MKKWVLWALGTVTVIVLIGVVFVMGRLTGTSSADAADTTTSSTSVAPTTTAPPPTTTIASAPPTGDAVALAGDDQIVSATKEVTLDGTRSTDPDEQDLVYTWMQTFGPDVTGGSGAIEGEEPTFTAPDSVSTLVFELTVDDGTVSDPDTVMVQVVEDAATAVFVDRNADVTGVGRGTMDDPFTTIAAGIAIAEDRGGVDIYLKRSQGGSYVLEDELRVPPNVSMYGGYGEDWLRDPTQPTALTGPGQPLQFAVDGLYTVISGLAVTASDSRGTSVAAQFVTDETNGGTVRIEDSILTGGEADRGSYGVIAEGAFDLTIVRTSIAAGTAGKGTDGAEAASQDGASAVAGSSADERDPGGGFNPGGEGGSALAGKGKKGTGNPTTLGGSGGDAGDDGDDGLQFGGVGGGQGGAGGTRDLWQGEGTPGSDGFHGREGGGGGGGGGLIGLEGGGGGGGGEGGKPGIGGGPGTVGYQSIGLYVDVAGTVVIEDSDFTGGRGGDGGDGGVGSPGLPGANGGKGDSGSCSFLGCGAGQAGDGGDGPGGGAGSQGGQGGGGAGGPSIGFMIDNAGAEVSLVGCKIIGGTGGTGGLGGFGGLSAEGPSGQTSGKNLVPGTDATATLGGSDGGSSFGLVFGRNASPDQVTNDDCHIDATNPGAPGEAPLPGSPGLSAATNA